MPLTKTQRLRTLTRIVGQESLHSQHDVQQRLADQGIRVTQATLSRDLTELGVLKGPSGYCLPNHAPSAPPSTLDSVARHALAGAEQAGHLVVLHTPPGQASALAVHLDRTAMQGVVGTIAGDDCVFVATRSPAVARALVSRLTGVTGRTRSTTR